MGDHWAQGMAWAVLSGLCAAVMGIAIRLGTRRGGHVSQIYLVICAAGLTFFAIRAAGGPRPGALVVVLALAGSASQYACVQLLRVALGRGPITAAWSAASLGFLPVSVYAAAALGEAITAGGVASVLMGIGCVLLASTLQAEPGAEAHPAARAGLAFGALLLGILLLNGLLGVFIKHLSSVPALADGLPFARHKDGFFALVYAGMCGCLLVEQLRARRAWAAPQASLLFGLVGAAGSAGYLALIARVADQTAAVVFTASNMAQVAGTFLLASLLVGERRTGRWYAVLGLALLSIAASQAESLLLRARW